MNAILKAEIIKVFWSQANFADHIGVSDSLISKVVRERRNLSQNEKTLWAESLGVSASYLFPQKRGENSSD
ncbi:helix-turn-helix domain-containing protein [Desulfatibacillum alkenivorans]|uniref:helix-turn-helix domain-containing protein n=1 Tax=Desulfatibacillum alkenivorans TaxID=259354 RepID=UPI00093672F4|nr:helix-turn-helix transcriptional regulator [Desulfatibacillum alkenivorans]